MDTSQTFDTLMQCVSAVDPLIVSALSKQPTGSELESVKTIRNLSLLVASFYDRSELPPIVQGFLTKSESLKKQGKHSEASLLLFAAMEWMLPHALLFSKANFRRERLAILGTYRFVHPGSESWARLAHRTAIGVLKGVCTPKSNKSIHLKCKVLMSLEELPTRQFIQEVASSLEGEYLTLGTVTMVEEARRVSIEEFAAEIGASEKTVYAWRKRSDFPEPITSTPTMVFDRSELHRFRTAYDIEKTKARRKRKS